MAIDGSPGPIVIIVAVRREADAVCMALSGKSHSHDKNQNLYFYSYKNRKIILSVVGIGIENAGPGAERVIREYSPEIIINIGYSGATDPILKCGNVVIGEEIYFEDDNERKFHSTSNLVSLTERVLTKNKIKYFKGKLVTVDHPLNTKKEKMFIC